MVPCSPVVLDVGPGIMTIALQLLTLAGVYLSSHRLAATIAQQHAVTRREVDSISTKLATGGKG